MGYALLQSRAALDDDKVRKDIFKSGSGNLLQSGESLGQVGQILQSSRILSQKRPIHFRDARKNENSCSLIGPL